MSTVPPPPPPPPPPSQPPPEYTPFGGSPVPRSNKRALWAMVCGILGLVICAPLSIVALVLGRQAQTEIDGSRGTMEGRGQATAGVVLGILGLVTWVLLIMYSFW